MIDVVVRGFQFGVDELDDGNKQVNILHEESGTYYLFPFGGPQARQLAARLHPELIAAAKDVLERWPAVNGSPDQLARLRQAVADAEE